MAQLKSRCIISRMCPLLLPASFKSFDPKLDGEGGFTWAIGHVSPLGLYVWVLDLSLRTGSALPDVLVALSREQIPINDRTERSLVSRLRVVDDEPSTLGGLPSFDLRHFLHCSEYHRMRTTTISILPDPDMRASLTRFLAHIPELVLLAPQTLAFSFMFGAFKGGAPECNSIRIQQSSSSLHKNTNVQNGNALAPCPHAPCA